MLCYAAALSLSLSLSFSLSWPSKTPKNTQNHQKWLEMGLLENKHLQRNTRQNLVQDLFFSSQNLVQDFFACFSPIL